MGAPIPSRGSAIARPEHRATRRFRFMERAVGSKTDLVEKASKGRMRARALGKPKCTFDFGLRSSDFFRPAFRRWPIPQA